MDIWCRHQENGPPTVILIVHPPGLIVRGIYCERFLPTGTPKVLDRIWQIVEEAFASYRSSIWTKETTKRMDAWYDEICNAPEEPIALFTPVYYSATIDDDHYRKYQSQLKD